MPDIDRAELNRWLEAVNRVMDEVRGWAASHGWRTKVEPITITEQHLGEYEVPVLTVVTGAGSLLVEPVARWASPGEGRIDVYGWPSLSRLMLIRQSGAWHLETEGAVPWPFEWSEETFTDLIHRLNAAA